MSTDSDQAEEPAVESDEEQSANQSSDTAPTAGETTPDEDLDAIIADLEEDGAQVYRGKKYISIRSNNVLAPSTTVYEQYLSDAEAVLLAMYDESKTMVMKPLQQNHPNHDSVSKITGDENPSISASGFLDEYDLKADQTHRYTPEWNDEKEYLEIDLDQTPEIISVSSPTENGTEE